MYVYTVYHEIIAFVFKYLLLCVNVLGFFSALLQLETLVYKHIQMN